MPALDWLNRGAAFCTAAAVPTRVSQWLRVMRPWLQPLRQYQREDGSLWVTDADPAPAHLGR